MTETNMYKERRQNELKSQHQIFAHEIILKLKYYYRLHEDESCPENVLFASVNICEAVIAISYVFRCHYREVYNFLHNKLIDSEEYEKYCLSLPVRRSKRFTFNFLFRLSLVFEISMYLFKEGYDYFHIARKCFATYPDFSFFHASGGWDKLDQIASYIIHVTKVSKVHITTEHPLLGNFIQTAQYISPEDNICSINQISQESTEIDQMNKSEDVPAFSEEFFNPKETQSLNVLYKHFKAPRTPKYKYKKQDLIKIHETFPLSNRAPFQIDDDLDVRYYIAYDLYVEKIEIYHYFRSYMDPEILERCFPLKPPDSQDVMSCKEDNLGNNSKCFNCNFSCGEMEKELSKLESHKDILMYKCNKKMESPHTYEESMGNIAQCCSSEQQNIKSDNTTGCYMKIHKSMKSSCETKEVDQTALCTGTNHTQSSNKTISHLPQSTSNIQDFPRDKKLELIKLLLDVTRLSKENKEIILSALPTNPESQCFDQSVLKNICGAIQQASERELSTVLTNMSYISTATKYLFFKIIGDCSNFSTEDRNGLFRLLVNIPDNTVAEKTNLFQIINNMCGCTEKDKSDLIKCIIDFTKEEFGELQLNELQHTSSDDMKTVDAFEGIFKNDDDLCKEFEQFMLLCQNESEIDIDKLQEFTAPLVGIENSRKIFKGNQVAKKASSAKSMSKQLCQEKNKPLNNNSDDDDDHNVCRCLDKGNVASGTSVSSSSKLLDMHCQESNVPNPSSNRQRRKTNKKSKRRSKK